MFDLTKEQVLQTLANYEKIMDRVAEVVDEIGFTTTEFNAFESDKTEFDKDTVYVTAYDSNYDSYDATSGSFPLDFLFESKESQTGKTARRRTKAKRTGISRIAEVKRKV